MVSSHKGPVKHEIPLMGIELDAQREKLPWYDPLGVAWGINDCSFIIYTSRNLWWRNTAATDACYDDERTNHERAHGS